ncbi:unnamed protein product [Prunus armeniaca]|uniref:Reverse transcriptase domain-containing protein n=1 Tax=Prunus armeniaca TaxID=36596 RepID=A0A6J5XDB2_PRUAR|nr:unnamed protein product [Prunus armeniaca]CAB4311689.1 unnamed protein product [Prunus armeniaca]
MGLFQLLIQKFQCFKQITADHKPTRDTFEEQFTELFKTNGNRDWGAILDCVIPVVTEEMNMELMKPVSTEEVNEAAFQMGGTKAPGLDGFNRVFYHNYWEIIRHEI